MKISFLTPTLEIHGGNIVMLNHAAFLSDHGHDITIVTTDKPIQLPIPPKVKVLQYKKVLPRYSDFFTFQLPYLNKVKNLIEECDYIIPIYAPLILHAIYAKKSKNLHAKVLPFFQDSLVTLWVGPYIKMLLKSNYVRKNIDKAVAVSRPGAEGFSRITGSEVLFVPLGIETDNFYQRDLKKEKYILFVGRPNKPKGFDIFKKVYTELSKTNPDLKALVVGPGLSARDEDGIQYVKYKDRAQLAKIFSKASLYISTSYAESFPMPPLEAMACGTATVITNTGGEKEYAVDNVNCFIRPIGDWRAISEAADLILKDVKIEARFIKEGLKTASRYSWKESNEKLMKYLEL
jgi:glycosyltransferase involved in cell wall biosynthesis